jgi:hypothetical protein
MDLVVFKAAHPVHSHYDDFMASIIKNVLFNMDNHDAVLDSVDLARLIQDCSNQPTLVLVEMLLLLCTTLRGRTMLRGCNVYECLKRAHAESSDDLYREMVEKVVELLVRDEDPSCSA